MDIKLLREVGRNGLERWEPVLKAEFPLSAERCGGRLRRTAPADAPAGAGAVHPGAVPHRTGRTRPTRPRGARVEAAGALHGSRAAPSEFTDIVVGDWLTRTIAIESEDLDAVVAGVSAVGLGARVNTSYPRGLGALYDGEPPRYATIDVGTNSVKFHIGQPAGDGTWQALVDRAEVTQLGEGLAQAGTISAEALARTSQAIRAMVEEARSHLVREIAAVGTAGLRIAENQAEVLAAIEHDTAWRFR